MTLMMAMTMMMVMMIVEMMMMMMMMMMTTMMERWCYIASSIESIESENSQRKHNTEDCSQLQAPTCSLRGETCFLV